MRHPERIPDALEHILIACNRAMMFTDGLNEQAFQTNLLVNDATIRALYVAGEAARRIRDEDPEFVERYGLSAFASVIGMRNRLAHEYDTIDLKIAWDTVAVDVPALRERVLQVLYELGHRPDPDSLHF